MRSFAKPLACILAVALFPLVLAVILLPVSDGIEDLGV